MADLQKQFLEFHNAIKLGTYEENDFLREKRDLIIDKLKSKLAERKDDGYPQYERSFNQGSYALNTGIKPVRTGDYDIDVGVLLDCHKEDYKPVELKELVADCIKHNNRTVEVSRSCVTVTYMKDGKPDYHVDLPIYAKSSNVYDDTYYLAKGRKSLAEDKRVWQAADPEGINSIINGLYKGNDNYENNGADQRKQFRRCVRYLKRWRNHKYVGVHSIGLTMAAYHWLKPEVDVKNDGEVLLNLVNSILSNFDWCDRLSIDLPVVPHGDLLKSVSDEDMAIIKERLETLRDNLQSAIDEPDAHEASKILRKSFGDDFPEVNKSDKAKKEYRSAIRQHWFISVGNVMTISDGVQQSFEQHIQSLNGKNIESEDRKDGFIAIGFDLNIHGQTIPLSVKYIDQKRWLLLPTVSVTQCNLPALDHVGNNGLICVKDHQGEMFDSADLFGLFKYTVDAAIDILTNSLKSYQAGNRIALYEEIDGYNQTIVSDAPVIVATHNPNQSDSLYAWCINCSRQRNTPQFYHIKYLVDGASQHPPSSSPYTAIKVTKISLPRIEDFVIPNLFTSFDEHWWEQQTLNFSTQQLDSLNKKSKFKIVLLEIPTPKMHTYLVISYYQDMASNKYRNFKVQTLQRGWREYLLNRTGIESQLSNKKTVVIAGCGSVGSRVAEMLAESDVDKLILIDNDDMKTDNIMRHYLGVQDVNQSKVGALKNRLQQNIPELEIVAYKTNILNWLISQNSEQLSEIHSIVLATGHPPTELEVCRRLYTYDTSVHVASGWLEAYGLGGHVLGFKSNKDACLKCLYYDGDGNPSNYIKTSLFSNPSGIVLSKNITGCAGAFTAYGSVHAMKTAVIIAEFVIELKTGLQSWCATNKLPIDYGLEATKHHEAALQNGGYYSQPLSYIKVAGCSCCST